MNIICSCPFGLFTSLPKTQLHSFKPFNFFDPFHFKINFLDLTHLTINKKRFNLQRGAFTWSMEATTRTWEQAAILARRCWDSESRNPVPSILWITRQTKHSLSCAWGPSRKAIISSIDRVLNSCWLLSEPPEDLGCSFSCSHNTSAIAIATYIFVNKLKV